MILRPVAFAQHPKGLFSRKHGAVTHSFASGFVPLDSVDSPDASISWSCPCTPSWSNFSQEDPIPSLQILSAAPSKVKL